MNRITRVIAQSILLDWDQFDPIMAELEFNLDYYAMNVNQNPDLAPVQSPPSYVEATTQPDLDLVVDSQAPTPLLDEEQEQLTEGQEDLQLDELRSYEALDDEVVEVEDLTIFSLEPPVRT